MRKSYVSTWTILLLCGIVHFTHAQTSIAGKVSDGQTGEPLAGVNIIVKGTVLGTISNAAGEFTLKAKDAPPSRWSFHS